jgi:hypothetical protein
VAALIWTIWGSRELRRRSVPPPADAPAPAATAPTAPPAPVAAPAPPAPADAWRGAKLQEVLESIRTALRSAPDDPRPLGRLDSLEGDGAVDALLEFVGSSHSKDVKLDALNRAAERGFSEKHVKRIIALYDAERDDDVRVAMLLGVERQPAPGSESLVRKGLADASEAVRGVALASLDGAREADRTVLLNVACSDPSDLVRGSAALQLAEQAADARVLELLLSMAVQDACDDNRAQIAGVLARDPVRADPRVQETLRRLAAGDRSPSVRGKAQAALIGGTK